MLRSIADYQQGHADEARRLALSVRMLVYDNARQQKSLLRHLGLKEAMLFYDTASEYDPRQYGSHLALLAMLIPVPGQPGQIPRADARLDAQPTSPKDEMQPFDKWWSTLVIRDDEGNTYSRRDILLTVADKDGGAHVDLNISPAYMNLLSGRATRWQVTSEEGKSFLEGIELATVRQIAHEPPSYNEVATFLTGVRSTMTIGELKSIALELVDAVKRAVTQIRKYPGSCEVLSASTPTGRGRNT